VIREVERSRRMICAPKILKDSRRTLLAFLTANFSPEWYIINTLPFLPNPIIPPSALLLGSGY